MKTFAFVSNSSLKNAYESILLKKKQSTILDMIKIGILFLPLLLSLIFYLRYVSLASTRGYFLRQENQKLSAVSFKYEILKTQLLEQKLQNWTVLDGDASQREMFILAIDPVVNSGTESTFFQRLKEKTQ